MTNGKLQPHGCNITEEFGTFLVKYFNNRITIIRIIKVINDSC